MMHLRIGMKELKLCPFCGSEAILVEHIENGKIHFIVRCGHCGCTPYEANKVNLSCENYQVIKNELKQNAIDLWNERSYEK